MKCTDDACFVDTSLVFFKFHFFLSHAGYSAVVPFMPVIAKQLGINATAFGIGFSLIPLFVFLSNPLFGFLVDFFQNIKIVLLIFILSSVAAYFSVLGIPKINDDSIFMQYLLFDASQNTYLNISEPLEKSCFEKHFDENIQCKMSLKIAFLPPNTTENVTDSSVPTSLLSKMNETFQNFKVIDHKQWTILHLKNVSRFNKMPELISLKQLHCSPNITQCLSNDNTSLIFSSYQYWAFTFTAIIGAITLTSVLTLSSVGCCEKLGPNVQAYGRQRVWGTIGHGLVTPLAGILSDVEIAAGKPFISGFYLLACFFTIDIVIVFIMDIRKVNISSNMCKDLGKIFSSKEILIFALCVVFIGIFNSIIAVYEFWFLEDLGATRTLLGLTVAMQCLGEAPFLFFSGWFVDKLGHLLCLVVVFSAFTTRFISYSLIKNPWLALPFDILHGLTFGLFHGTMTSFAKVKAPKGMEATLLGTLGGLYDGLGYGIGSFVGGICLDYFGSRNTFFTTGMIGLGCVLISFFTTRTLKNGCRQIPPETENSLHLEEKFISEH